MKKQLKTIEEVFAGERPDDSATVNDIYKSVYPAYRVLLEKGQLEQALQLLSESIQKFPNDFFLQDAYTSLLVLRKQNEEATQAVQRLKEIDPQSAIPYFYEATLYMRKGDREGAAQLLLHAPHPHDNAFVQYCLLGEAAFYQTDYLKAVQYLLLAEEIQPWNPSFKPFLGQALFNVKRFSEARQILHRAVEQFPQTDHTWYVLGRAEFVLKNWSEASRCFEEALRQNSRDANYYALLMRSLWNNRHYLSALGVMGKAIMNHEPVR